MRVSGIVLLGLALGHMVLMHMIYGVEHLDYALVADRFAQLGWRLYDLLMLILGVLHGFNGLRTIVDDVVRDAGRRRAAVRTIYVVGGILLVIGSVTIILFQPQGIETGP